MNLYEKQINKELKQWHEEIIRESGIIERTSGKIQKQTQKLMPAKIQNAITAAIEVFVETMLNGSGLLSIKDRTDDMTLAERDYLVHQMFGKYQKTATVQGAGFGMGGIVLGMADLPVLMSIKIKFLFDAAKLYGYDPERPDERLFLLHVFQLAFSSKEHGLKVFDKLAHWDSQSDITVDWETFQIEYRDYIDFAKMLQLLPVIGSVAGGTANYKLMSQLCKTVMNCYRMRILGRTFPEQKLPSSVHASK